MRRPRPAVVLSIAATIALAGLMMAQAPPGDAPPPQTDQQLARTLAARAKLLEDAGRAEQAIAAYAAAAALDLADADARGALVRLVATPITTDSRPGDVGPPSSAIAAERTRREALETTVRELRRAVDAQEEDLRKLGNDLSDKGRAEPITDRLNRDVQDLERQLDRQAADLLRLQRQIDGVQRDVDRLRSQIR